MTQRREPTEVTAERASAPQKAGRLEHQAHYMSRLRRLLQLRREHLGDLNQDGLWLLDRCIFATYRDCVEVGAGSAAQQVLRSVSSASGSNQSLIGPTRRPRQA